MSKRMIKVMKLGLALSVIFAAAPVRAEISVEMGVEGYVPGAYSRAAELRAGQLERLAAAVESLEASADAASSEVLLAGLYSGSVAAEKAAPVYAAAAALPAPAALPVRNVRRAVSVKSAIEEIGADEPAAGDAGAVPAEDADGGAATAGDADVTAADSGSEDDDSKPTAGSMLLAGMMVVALAFLIFYAPMLLLAL